MAFAILEHSKTSLARSELVEKRNGIGIMPTYPLYRLEEHSRSHSATRAGRNDSSLKVRLSQRLPHRDVRKP